jgi:hypothetical protein
MKRLALLLAALMAVTAACGGKSKQQQARDWVQANGGHVGVDDSGWIAQRETWTGEWPWTTASAVVGCAPSTYGGTTFVQLGTKRYWLTETHGYPPDGGTYAASAASVTTDDLAQIEWSNRSADLCALH